MGWVGGGGGGIFGEAWLERRECNAMRWDRVDVYRCNGASLRKVQELPKREQRLGESDPEG